MESKEGDSVMGVIENYNEVPNLVLVAFVAFSLLTYFLTRD